MTKIISFPPKFIFALLAIALCLQLPAQSINRTTLTPLSVHTVKPHGVVAAPSRAARATQPSVYPSSRVRKQTLVAKKVQVRSSAGGVRKGATASASAKQVATKKKTAVLVSTKVNLRKGLRVKVAKKQPPMSLAQRAAIQQMFRSGTAVSLSPTQLVAAGVFKSYPLRGGVFRRKNWPSTLVIHSTETASVATAKAIIRSWNNGGTYHAGTQYIVDRDGVIYQTVDPAYATYHVDSSKTLLGVKNENSIGIETVRTADQFYTDEQMKSLTALAHYLKTHFALRQVVGHGQVQPSDRSDPVLFDWSAFRQGLAMLDENQLAWKRTSSKKA